MNHQVTNPAAPPHIRLPRYHVMRTDWLARAALLPGRTLHYAIAVHMLACIADSPVLVVGSASLVRFGVTRDAAGDALTRLIEAGLIRAERGRGRTPVITLIDRGGVALVLGGAVGGKMAGA